MKSIRIQAFILTFSFMMPLVFNSITMLTDTSDNYELFEYSTEEEENSDTQEGTENIDDFLLHDQLDLAIIGIRDFEYFARNKEFISISGDTLTPPPKFS